ncbi:hypothetical protein BU14_2713s0001 [Porphyra umbilicalis]|uniref:Uncharacterized protein n=1 Tax=Porphyra umbilicalis TaxID=2786 RepID=A0A1X6NJ53_PORUM|nr:hypothetical protein BU14_2713s0001 [Porphyra umbilicalis]|eukprot:OSX68486.1 hypothetical protein BU14_2713s0001 [Porphyra umbilicalis]
MSASLRTRCSATGRWGRCCGTPLRLGRAPTRRAPTRTSTSRAKRRSCGRSWGWASHAPTRRARRAPCGRRGARCRPSTPSRRCGRSSTRGRTRCGGRSPFATCSCTSPRRRRCGRWRGGSPPTTRCSRPPRRPTW